MADSQNRKSDVMAALRVVCQGYRRSNLGDPASGTPPFAQIIDGEPLCSARMTNARGRDCCTYSSYSLYEYATHHAVRA